MERGSGKHLFLSATVCEPAFISPVSSGLLDLILRDSAEQKQPELVAYLHLLCKVYPLFVSRQVKRRIFSGMTQGSALQCFKKIIRLGTPFVFIRVIVCIQYCSPTSLPGFFFLDHCVPGNKHFFCDILNEQQCSCAF